MRAGRERRRASRPCSSWSAGAAQPDSGSVDARRLASSSATSRSTRWRCSTRRATSWRRWSIAFRRRRSGRSRTSPALRLLRRRRARRACACSPAARRRVWCWRMMLYDPPNFLVLDEPTNHLDIAHQGDAHRARSRDFEGTMLFVSHDRHFLAELSNRVLELHAGRAARLRRRLHGVRRPHRPRSPRPPLKQNLTAEPQRNTEVRGDLLCKERTPRTPRLRGALEEGLSVTPRLPGAELLRRSAPALPLALMPMRRRMSRPVLRGAAAAVALVGDLRHRRAGGLGLEDLALAWHLGAPAAWRVSFQSCSRSSSSGEQNVEARPAASARAVRPMRCT